MRRNFLTMAGMVIWLLVIFNFSWASCPEDPNDLGFCDTLHVVPWTNTDTCIIYKYADSTDTICINTPGEKFPCFLYVNLLVTHDSNRILEPGPYYGKLDSISAMTIPLGWTRTNPAKYCSLSTYWNENTTDVDEVDLYPRRIWRNFPPLDKDSINLMGKLKWETMLVSMSSDSVQVSGEWTPPHVFMSLIAGSTKKKWFQEKDTLLATLTFRIEDTMHVCIDTTFWPPCEPACGNLLFVRYDAESYIPRSNLSVCIWVGPPRIEVTSPDGGEVWCVDETHDITWISEKFSDSVKIEYSTNGGKGGWNTIIAKTENDGVHPWTIPNTPSALCRVRVLNAGGGGVPSGMSDGNFTISVPLSITVTSPNGGDSLAIGSSKNITWTSTGVFDSVKIELTRDGSTWEPLVAKTPNNGNWTWSPVTGLPSTTCKVRISNAAGGVPVDTSDNNFTIYQEAITVTYPNGGESFPIGGSKNITWTWSGSFDSVKIELTRDGSTWETLVAKTLNDGNWTWTPVTGPASTTCRVKICDKDGTPCDTSNLDFSIVQPDFTILATPDTQWVTRGDSTAYTVNLDSIYGFSSPCSLSVAGLPTGAKGKFVPSIITPPGSSILAINTYADSIAVGEYKPIITGRNGSLIHSDTVTFIVEPCTTTTHFTFTETDSSFTIIVDSALLYQAGLEDCDEIAVFDSDLCVGASVYSQPGKASLVLLAWKDSDGFPTIVKNGYIEGHPMSFKIWSKEQDQEEDARPHFPGGDSTFGPPGDTSEVWLEAPPPDFSIHVIPDTLKVPRGYSGNYKVILTSISGFAPHCTLTVVGHPNEFTATFNPPVLFPTDSSILTLSIPANTELDTFTLRITASEEEISHYKDVTLIVTLPTWIFEVDAFPDTQIIVQGNYTTYDVTIRPNQGFTAPCTLFYQFAGGLPSGVTADFDSNPIPPNDTSTLTITTSLFTLSTPPDTYDLAIIAVAEKKQKDTTYVKLIVEDVTGVDGEGDQPNAPDRFALFQNHPNPFNPETEISYYLSQGCEVKLTIYNILGRRVKTLFEGHQNAGMKTLVWDGKDDQGKQLSSGIYFYRLQAGEFIQTRKMSLIK